MHREAGRWSPKADNLTAQPLSTTLTPSADHHNTKCNLSFPSRELLKIEISSSSLSYSHHSHHGECSKCNQKHLFRFRIAATTPSLWKYFTPIYQSHLPHCLISAIHSFSIYLTHSHSLSLSHSVSFSRSHTGAPWQGHGHVMWIEDGEIALEMRCTSIPHTISEGYVAEFVWKSTSYDR